MPIEFAPPPVGNLQGFQIPGPQYTDPLATLAQMQQMKTQRIQQQSADLQLQQAQMKMASQRAMLKAFVDAGKDQEPAPQAQAPPQAQAAPAPGVIPPTFGTLPPPASGLPSTFGTLPTPDQGIAPPLTTAPSGAVTPSAAPPSAATPSAPSAFGLSSLSSPYLDRVFRNAVKNGALPEDLTTLQTHILNLEKQTLALDETKRTMLNQDIDTYRGRVENVIQTANDPKASPRQIQAALDSANRYATGKNLFQRGDFTPLTYVPDVDHLRAYSNSLTGYSQLLGEASKRTEQAKTIAETGKATAETGEAGAKTQQTQLETQLAQHKLDLYNTLNQNPQALDKRVDTSINPQKYPDFNARAKNEARQQPDLEGINKVIENYSKLASEQEKTIATETDPDVTKARVRTAVAIDLATAPLKTQQAIATAKALRMGDNPAVAGVAPAAVLGVQNQAIKLDEQYAKEKAITETVGRVLDLAQSGNKVAGTNLPLLGVETLNAINGIKRINRAEIDQYAGAGDLLDQIKGKIGKLVQGKPIPQDVLDDMRQFHQSVGQQAWQVYNNSLDAVNNRSGSKFAPTLEAPNINRTRPGGSPPIPASIPQQYRSTAHYSPSQKTFYYSKDGGKTWLPAPAQ